MCVNSDPSQTDIHPVLVTKSRNRGHSLSEAFNETVEELTESLFFDFLPVFMYNLNVICALLTGVNNSN